MTYANDIAISLAALFVLTVLPSCLAAQLRPVTSRLCAEAIVAVEHCERGSCTNASMRNEAGEEWATLDEWKRERDSVCALDDAVHARKVGE
jgi:hypothetical protein